MTQSEILQKLRNEGLSVTKGKIAYAALTGKIDRPCKDGASNNIYTARHIEQFRVLLAVPQKRGRKSAGN